MTANPVIRWVLIACGVLLTGIGLVGIVVPLLPTTPFLLMASACFIRSSPRMHRWLLSNRVFGSYISDYVERRGMTALAKSATIVLLWASLSVFALLMTESLLVRGVLAVVGVAVTAHILLIRTRRPAGA